MRSSYYTYHKVSRGDKVMWANDYTDTIYTVTDSFPQSRDRIVIEDCQTKVKTRVSQNTVRKLSGAEISVINAYHKLIKDVITTR